eukprot:6184904-Pleurochrysis_carterae.AAC.2
MPRTAGAPALRPTAHRSSGSASWTDALLKAVPSATHSCLISGMPDGIVSASPVVVDAGRTDATASGGSCSARPARAVHSISAGATTRESAARARHWRRSVARCECAYSPSVTMHGCTAVISTAPAHRTCSSIIEGLPLLRGS